MKPMTPNDYRTSLGLSIADMARALNIHRQTWVKWERGEQQPPAVAITAMRLLWFLHMRGELDDWRMLISDDYDD
jgi:DNA-binding transcriptional regulator YiaG